MKHCCNTAQSGHSWTPRLRNNPRCSTNYNSWKQDSEKHASMRRKLIFWNITLGNQNKIHWTNEESKLCQTEKINATTHMTHKNVYSFHQNSQRRNSGIQSRFFWGVGGFVCATRERSLKLSNASPRSQANGFPQQSFESLTQRSRF